IAYEAGRWPMSRVAPGRRTTHLVQVGEWQHAARRFAPQVVVGDAGVADGHPAAEDLDAGGGQDGVDALMGVGGGGGVLAAPGGGGPAVLEFGGEAFEGAAVGAFVEVAARDRVFHAECGEAVEEHAALFVPLVLLQGEVTGQYAHAGATEADHCRGEAASVQAGGERQQDVLGVLDGGPEAAQKGRAGGRGAAGEGHQAGGRGQPREFLAPAEEAGGLLDEDQIGGAGGDDAGEGGGVVPHGADVVAEDADCCRTVRVGAGLGEGRHVDQCTPKSSGVYVRLRLPVHRGLSRPRGGAAYRWSPAPLKDRGADGTLR
ncbi:hypothetical protein STRIP9103_02345, partial [Streptomyces ipomoeae 91-03]